jgi:ERCC4-type nuclease
MKIFIDERETFLYEKCQSMNQTSSIQLFKKVLTLGDILICADDDKELVLIERKSLADLLASIKDGRYEEQSYRLIHSSGFHTHNIVYIIEGMFSQLRSPMEKKIIYSAMTSLNFFKGFSATRTCSLQETAEMILSIADKIERENGKGKTPHFLNKIGDEPISLENAVTTPANYCTVVKKTKKDNITPENIGEIILCQIPGISSITAITIMKHFSSFPHLIEELKTNPLCLDDIVIETNGKTRKINKSSIQNVKLFLLGQNGP